MIACPFTQFPWSLHRNTAMYAMSVPSLTRRIGLPAAICSQRSRGMSAMRAGLFNTDDYLNEWRTGEAQEREGAPAAVAAAVAAEVEAAFSDEQLEALAANGGRLP